jgi:two-component system chemotaxis sensor kinase CheA
MLPILSIGEYTIAKESELYSGADGNKKIIINHELCTICLIDKILGVRSDAESIPEGVLIKVKTERGSFCLLVDELITERRAVIRPLPQYLKWQKDRVGGIGGCGILADGSIRLLLDVDELIHLS